jgi:dihydroorotate dehydrogenase electron transfer subunit
MLHLRGPLGRGFDLPPVRRKVGLVAFDDSPARLMGLIRPAVRQAAVVLVCSSAPDNLPDDVEVQPLSALRDVLEWADYLAFDIARENLNSLREQLGNLAQLAVVNAAQVLIRTPVPCGGIADCGVCAVTLKSEWKLACKDGPVFDWGEL